MATISSIFTWIFNDSGDVQSAYYIEYGRTLNGSPIFNTGWVTSPNSQHEFASGTFTVNAEYKWRVKAKDSINQESVFSEWAVFTATGLPVATITFPAADMDVVNNLPVYEHTLSNTQTKFQYKLYDPTVWTDIEALTWAQIEAMTWDELESFSDVLLWDSGIVYGTGTTLAQPAGYLDGNKVYKLMLEAWDIYGNSDTDRRIFGVDMNIPPTPTVTAEGNSDLAAIILSIANPAPGPGQPAAASNKIYRQEPTGAWVLEAEGITASTYAAKVFSSGKTATYAVSAVAADGAESGKSLPATATVIFSDYWLIDPDTNESFKLISGVSWGRMVSEREREETWGADEVYPSVTYGQARFYRGSFQAAVIGDSEASSMMQAKTLRTLIDGSTKKSMWFKSPFGDVFKVDIYNFKVQPKLPGDFYRMVSFDMVETGINYENYLIGEYGLPPATPTTFWVIDPDTGRGVEFDTGVEWEGFTSERDRAENKTFGESYPTVGYGKMRALRSSFSGHLLVDDDMPTTLNKVRNLLDAPNKKPLVFITPLGERFLVDIYNFSFELALGRLGRIRKVSFEMVEVGAI